MIYENLTPKLIYEHTQSDQEIIEAARRNIGFVTIPKIKLREIQEIARQVNQFYIAALIEDLLN